MHRYEISKIDPNFTEDLLSIFTNSKRARKARTSTKFGQEKAKKFTSTGITQPPKDFGTSSELLDDEFTNLILK